MHVELERKRFVVRPKCVNQFQMLLDEVEEFGYTVARSLKLPYSVELFQVVLCKVE